MYQAGVTSWALLSCLLALTRTTDTTNTAGLSSTAAAFRAFRSSHHDGTWRSVDIATKETLNSFQGVSGAGVVYYHGEQEATARGASWSAGRHMLELTAQALQAHDLRVGMVNMERYPSLAHRQGVETEGTLHVYLGGRTHIYQGLHSPDSLVSFILKLNTPALGKIQGKAQRKAFDKVEGPKLVGLFEKDSNAYEEFERAAQSLHPYVSCHAVFDPKVLEEKETDTEIIGVAKYLHDKSPGTILYFSPFQDDPIPLPGEVSVPEIRTFVSRHQRSFLRRIYPYDLYATLGQNQDSRHLVLVFLLPRSAEGMTLLKTLKRLANSPEAAHRYASINVLYANMDDFPLMVGTLEQEFSVDLSKPAMGLINTTTGAAVWFTQPELHLVSDKDNQQKVVADWLNRIANGNIRVDGVPVDTSEGGAEIDEQDAADGSEQTKDQTERKQETETKTDYTKEDEPKETLTRQEDSEEDDDGVPDFFVTEGEEEQDPAGISAETEVVDDSESKRDEKEEVKEKAMETEEDEKDEDEKDDDEDEKDKHKKDKEEDEKDEKEEDGKDEKDEDEKKEDEKDEKDEEDEKEDTAELTTKTDDDIDDKEEDTVSQPEEVQDEQHVHPLEHSKDSAYMLQFYDGDKILTKLFAMVYNVGADVVGSKRWEVGPARPAVKTEQPEEATTQKKKKKKVKRPPRIDTDYRNLNYNPNYLRHGEDADKFVINSFKFIGRTIAIILPFQWPESKEVTPERTSVDQKQADKDYRNLNYNPNYIREGEDADKLMINSIKFMLRPITYVFNLGSKEEDIPKLEKPKRTPRWRKRAKPVIPDADLPEEYFINLPKKPLPSYGDDSDKVMTNFLKMIFGVFTYFIPEFSPPPKPIPKESYVPGKLKPLPSYGGESDKVMKNFLKGIYRTVTSIIPVQLRGESEDRAGATEQLIEKDQMTDKRRDSDDRLKDDQDDDDWSVTKPKTILDDDSKEKTKVDDGDGVKMMDEGEASDDEDHKKKEERVLQRRIQDKNRAHEKGKEQSKKEPKGRGHYDRHKDKYSSESDKTLKHMVKLLYNSISNLFKMPFIGSKADEAASDAPTKQGKPKQDSKQDKEDASEGSVTRVKNALQNAFQQVKDALGNMIHRTKHGQEETDDKPTEEHKKKQDGKPDSKEKKAKQKPKKEKLKIKPDIAKKPDKPTKLKTTKIKRQLKKESKKERKPEPVQRESGAKPKKKEPFQQKAGSKEIPKETAQKTTQKAIKKEKPKQLKDKKVKEDPEVVSKQKDAPPVKVTPAKKKFSAEINQEDKVISNSLKAIYTSVRDLILGRKRADSPQKQTPVPWKPDLPKDVKEPVTETVDEVQPDDEGRDDEFLKEAFKTVAEIDPLQDPDHEDEQDDFLTKAFSAVTESESLEDGDEFTPKEQPEGREDHDTSEEHDDKVSKSQYLEELFQDDSYSLTGEDDEVNEDDDRGKEFSEETLIIDDEDDDIEAIFTDVDVSEVDVEVDMDDTEQPEPETPDEMVGGDTVNIQDVEGFDGQGEEGTESYVEQVDDDDDEDDFLQKAFASYAEPSEPDSDGDDEDDDREDETKETEDPILSEGSEQDIEHRNEVDMEIKMDEPTPDELQAVEDVLSNEDFINIAFTDFSESEDSAPGEPGEPGDGVPIDTKDDDNIAKVSFPSKRYKKLSQKKRYRDVRWHYVPESDDPREPYQREVRLSQDGEVHHKIASLLEHGKTYGNHKEHGKTYGKHREQHRRRH